MPTSLPLLTIQGTPDDGVTEVQLLTPGGTISGGDFTVTFDGSTTDPIDWDATIPEIQAALEALDNIGEGNLVVTGDDPETPTELSDGGVLTLTFAGALAGLPQVEVIVDDAGLTGKAPTITPSTDTQGFRGSYRGAQGGCLLQDELNAYLFVNTSAVANVPVWTDYSQVEEH